MKVRILTLRFDSIEGRFIDDAFVELNEEMEVVDCTQHFFESDGVPYLLLVARCREWVQSTVQRPGSRPVTKSSSPGLTSNKAKSSGEISSAAVHLSVEEKRRFDALRQWRTGKARTDGVPTYIICRDRTLAELAQANPVTLNGLNNIRGLGSNRIAQFGAELLAVLHAVSTPDEASTRAEVEVSESNPVNMAADEATP